MLEIPAERKLCMSDGWLLRLKDIAASRRRALGGRLILSRGPGFGSAYFGNPANMLYGLVGLLIVVAIVLFLAKVAIGGGVIRLLALLVLIYVLFNR